MNSKDCYLIMDKGACLQFKGITGASPAVSLPRGNDAGELGSCLTGEESRG